MFKFGTQIKWLLVVNRGEAGLTHVRVVRGVGIDEIQVNRLREISLDIHSPIYRYQYKGRTSYVAFAIRSFTGSNAH